MFGNNYKSYDFKCNIKWLFSDNDKSVFLPWQLIT